VHFHANFRGTLNKKYKSHARLKRGMAFLFGINGEYTDEQQFKRKEKSALHC
jgi:hypothetical protein